MNRPDQIPAPPPGPGGLRGEHPGRGPAPGPDDWPIHRLLSIAARLDERWINRNLTQVGLTKSALDVLEAVAELQPANVSDLASLLCISKQSLGSTVRRLHAAGLLAKERGADRRNADIRLTGRGEPALQAAEDLLRQLPHTAPEAGNTLRGQLQRHIHELTLYEAHHLIPQPPRSSPR